MNKGQENAVGMALAQIITYTSPYTPVDNMGAFLLVATLHFIMYKIMVKILGD